MSTIQALFGGAPKSTPPTEFPASQPTHYPTDEDVDFARKNDFSYGQPWAPEFNNQSIKLLTSDPNDKNLKGETFGGLPLQNLLTHRPDLPIKNDHAKAALAVENSALAKLGYDPNHVFVDPLTDPKNYKIGAWGTYTPSTDQIYSNAFSPNNIVHESIHRGMEKLKGSPFWKPEFGHMDDEMIVRHLMATKMGNPEAANSGELGTKQRKQADYYFNESPYSDARKKMLDQIEDAAAQYIAKKHPGGPR